MGEPSFKFPSLQRDLAIIGAGVVACAALVGAAIGWGGEKLIHHHRGTLR